MDFLFAFLAPWFWIAAYFFRSDAGEWPTIGNWPVCLNRAAGSARSDEAAGLGFL